MTNQVITAFMLAEATVFGILSYAFYRKKKSQLAGCERTWGDVMEVKEHAGSEDSTKHPVIRFRTPRGEDITFESKFGGSNWQVKPGDRLEVFYHPQHPADAEVVSFMAQWALPMIMGVVCVASLIGAPIVFLMLKHG
jgi:hypothetical protein